MKDDEGCNEGRIKTELHLKSGTPGTKKGSRRIQRGNGRIKRRKSKNKGRETIQHREKEGNEDPRENNGKNFERRFPNLKWQIEEEEAQNRVNNKSNMTKTHTISRKVAGCEIKHMKRNTNRKDTKLPKENNEETLGEEMVKQKGCRRDMNADGTNN